MCTLCRFEPVAAGNHNICQDFWSALIDSSDCPLNHNIATNLIWKFLLQKITFLGWQSGTIVFYAVVAMISGQSLVLQLGIRNLPLCFLGRRLRMSANICLYTRLPFMCVLQVDLPRSEGYRWLVSCEGMSGMAGFRRVRLVTRPF